MEASPKHGILLFTGLRKHGVNLKGPRHMVLKRARGKQAPDVGHVRATAKRKSKQGLSNRARFCQTCDCLKKDGPRHKHDFPDHILVPLTAEQKGEQDAGEKQDDEAPFFTFGKYKHKSFSWVKAHHPSYFMWLFQERFSLFRKYTWLSNALVTAGIFPESLLKEETAGDRKAREIIDSWHHETGRASPAERNVESVAENVVEVTVPSPKKPESERKKQRAITLFKSIPPEQRDDAYVSKAARRALVPQSRSGLHLKRSSPVSLTLAMLEDGVFEDLRGRPCQADTCKQWGTSEDSVLGRLSSTADGRVPGNNITSKAVSYRCLRCRSRHSVTTFNPLFPSQEGHGSWGASMAVFTYFMTVEGYTLTHIARELDVSEGYVRLWMARARYIMALDAERRQKEIVFGNLPDPRPFQFTD